MAAVAESVKRYSRFFKTLSHEELDAFLTPHGLSRISHYYRSHAVAAIYQMV